MDILFRMMDGDIGSFRAPAEPFAARPLARRVERSHQL